MTGALRLIRAFIASPGGLDEERRAARAAAIEVDTTIARPFGYTIELYGWEDTISGNGRPQDIINAELDECDLFIGAMWTKWGSPPDTGGGYTSGFEEEFERSLARYRATSYPKMAIFFKNVALDRVDDPGTELQKVLDFKERLIREKPLMFNSFESSQEFGQKVREFLTSQLVQRYIAPRKSADESSANLGSPPAERSHKKDDLWDATEPVVYPTESAFLRSAAAKVGTRTEHGIQLLSDVEIARLRLISSIFAEASNDREFLGVHDSGSLYRDQDNLELGTMELYHLLMSAVASVHNELRAPWIWLSKLGGFDNQVLPGLTINSSEEVKIGALQLMRWIPFQFADEGFMSRRLVEEEWLGGASDKVRVAALQLLREVGTEEDLAAIRREVERSNNTTFVAAVEALLSILVRMDERLAAREMLRLTFLSLDKEVLDAILRAMRKLSDEELTSSLDHRSPDVRANAIHLLARRGDIDAALLERALGDDSVLVRRRALEALDDLVGPSSYSDARRHLVRTRRGGLGTLAIGADDQHSRDAFDDYWRARLSGASVSQLRAELVHRDRDQDTVFLTLLDKEFLTRADELRTLLETRFASYLEDGDGKVRVPAGPISNALLRAVDPLEIRRRRLIQKGAEILSRRRKPADLAILARLIEGEDVHASHDIVDYFEAIGKHKDINSLIQAYHNIPGTGLLGRDVEPKLLFAIGQAIRRIGGDEDEPEIDLLPSPVISFYLSSMPLARFKSVTNDFVLKLLQDPNDTIRRSAARRSILAFSRTRVSAIMKMYMSSGKPYYYNVVFWLDLGLRASRESIRTIVSRSERSIRPF